MSQPVQPDHISLDVLTPQLLNLLNSPAPAPIPRRAVQVNNLNTLPKVSQYTDIDASYSGYGPNACGIVAAAAALGGNQWQPLAAKMRKAAGDSYRPDAGIQPSYYVRALDQVLPGRVTARDQWSLEEMYRELAAGNIVVVDIKVNAYRNVPSTRDPNYAHFARVLGYDVDRQEIYIQNTLWGSAYWTLNPQQFVQVWGHPETSSTLIPDPQHAEDVNYWAVVIKP